MLPVLDTRLRLRRGCHVYWQGQARWHWKGQAGLSLNVPEARRRLTEVRKGRMCRQCRPGMALAEVAPMFNYGWDLPTLGHLQISLLPLPEERSLEFFFGPSPAAFLTRHHNSKCWMFSDSEMKPQSIADWNAANTCHLLVSPERYSYNDFSLAVLLTIPVNLHYIQVLQNHNAVKIYYRQCSAHGHD